MKSVVVCVQLALCVLFFFLNDVTLAKDPRPNLSGEEVHYLVTLIITMGDPLNPMSWKKLAEKFATKLNKEEGFIKPRSAYDLALFASYHSSEFPNEVLEDLKSGAHLKKGYVHDRNKFAAATFKVKTLYDRQKKLLSNSFKRIIRFIDGEEGSSSSRPVFKPGPTDPWIYEILKELYAQAGYPPPPRNPSAEDN